MKEQVILIFIGALISLVTTVVNRVLDDVIDNKGKVRLYKKLVYVINSDGRTAGFYGNNGNEKLLIPLWIETQNTKKRPVIIRDFCLYLYLNNEKIERMVQINKTVHNSKDLYFGNEGSYSFIIPAIYIQKFELLFAMKKSEINREFDEVRIEYFDEKEKRYQFTLLKIENPWEAKSFGIDDDWVKIN